MLALLRKDLITNKKSFIIMSIVEAVVIAAPSLGSREALKTMGVMFFIMGSILVPMMSNRFGATSELRKLYDVLINSFPVKRKDVVISKYIYYLGVYFANVIIQGIVLFSLNSWARGAFHYILVALVFTFLFYVLVIGCNNYAYYKYDYYKAMKYSSSIIILAVFIPQGTLMTLDKFFPEVFSKLISILKNNLTLIGTIMFLVGISIYVVLTALSIKNYENKDLQ